MTQSEYKVLVVIAGIPEEISADFSKQLDRLREGRRNFVFVPMPRHRSYSDEYVAELYKLFVGTLRKFIPLDYVNNNTPDWFEGAVTIYIEHEKRRPEVLIDAFGIETFMTSIEVAGLPITTIITPNSVRSICNSLIRSLRRAIRASEQILPAIQKQVTSNSNKTPLLLPFQHFDFKIMSSLRENVNSLIDAAEPISGILKVVKDFEKNATQVKYDSDSFRSFMNTRQLVFRRPSAWHGANAVLATGHQSSCQVRSRLRFGACINPRFHYDCVRKKGKLPVCWRSCHGQPYTLPSGRRHINIAPSDHVR